MWARVIEVMLGCWLAVSHFVLAPEPSSRFADVNAAICGFLAAALGIASYVPPLQRIHLITILVGTWLVGSAFLDWVPPFRTQNQLTVGLLLILTAIVPSWSHRPPRSWTDFYRSLERKEGDR